MPETMSRYSTVFDLAGAYTDEDWGIVSGHHWDRLAAIAGEWERGEYTEDVMRGLVTETVSDVRREALRIREAEGQVVNVAEASPVPVSPLDLLLGDVVLTMGMTVRIDHVITWDADPAADHSRPGAPGYRPRRVAAAWGEVIGTFPGGPTGRWNVQGNDLHHLGAVYRPA